MEALIAPPQRENLPGRFGPFAARWSWAVLFGFLACGSYWLTKPVIVRQFTPMTQLAYGVPVYYGPPAILLLVLFVFHKRWCFPDLRFVGDVSPRLATRGILAVTIIYLAAYGAALWIGQPREPSMMLLYAGKTPDQIAVMLVSLVILPPIVEELVFRHFLLSVLPFKMNDWMTGIATIGTAALFALMHTGYKYPTTYVLLFTLGVVFALARIRSVGLALPIGLHAYAVTVALVCDQVVMRLQA